MTLNGDTLRKIRRRLKLTQADLGEELGVTANTVARWERDEVPITAPMERLIRQQEAMMANVTEDHVEAAAQTLAEYFTGPASERAAHRKARRASAVITAYARKTEKQVAQLRAELLVKRALLNELREFPAPPRKRGRR